MTPEKPSFRMHAVSTNKKELRKNSRNSLIIKSGYQDLNLGPPAPKAGALPDCATSRNTRRSDATGVTKERSARRSSKRARQGLFAIFPKQDPGAKANSARQKVPQ